MTVISLTTIPSRFDLIGPTLETLLAQKADIESIRLYIPQVYRRFPDYDGSTPKVPDGIKVVRTAEDLGPASKVLFAARELRESGNSIIFCDDDKLFPMNWAATLIKAAQKYPNRAICFAGEQISKFGFDIPKEHHGLPRPALNSPYLSPSYIRKRVPQRIGMLFGKRPRGRPSFRRFRRPGVVDFFEGFRGVLVKPEWFDGPFYDLKPVTWAVDDIWLSGHLARCAVPIWTLAAPARMMPITTSAHFSDPLLNSIIDGHDRLEANRACVRYFQERYGVWL